MVKDILQVPIPPFKFSEADLRNATRLKKRGREAEAYYKEQKELRYDLLFKKYGVAKENKKAWEFLAKCLAAEFVPGFSEHSREAEVGRKVKWSAVALALLWCEVEDLRNAEPKLTEEKLCAAVLERPYWGEFVGEEPSAPNLIESRKESFARVYRTSKSSTHVVAYEEVVKSRRMSKPAKVATFEQFYKNLAIVAFDSKTIKHPKGAVKD
jgi:hypothetical protein